MSFARFFLQESKYLYKTDIKSVLTWLNGLFWKVEESKRPRDLRPFLKRNGECNAGYRYDSLHMALLSKDRAFLSVPTHCRDYINEAVRHYVSGTNSYHVHFRKDDMTSGDVLDHNRFRMVLLFEESKLREGATPFEEIRNGVRVANMYGRVAGWHKLRVCRAKVPKGEESVREVYVLVGDKNWQRTPQFISMLLLLIRICLVHEVPGWIKDAYSLQGYWAELFRFPEIRPSGSDFSDFLYRSYDRLLTLVAHEREIFPHGMHENYHNDLEGFHHRSGLDSLVSGASIDKHASFRLRQLYMEVLENAGKESENNNWN